MIEVELPDGTIAEFPAGTSEAVMLKALQSYATPAPAPAAAAAPAELGGLNDMGMPHGAMPPGEGMQLPSAQTALDLALQGVGTAGGMAAGAPAGPVGSIALGGAGAAGGKYASRWLGQQLGLDGSEFPPAGESALDAVAGAAGPVVGAAVRPAARALSGVSREAASKVQTGRAAATKTKAAADHAEKLGKRSHEAMSKNPFGPSVAAAHGTTIEREAAKLAKKVRTTKQAADEAAQALTDSVVAGVAKSGKLPQDAGKLGALIMGVAHGDLASAAALLGAGVGASKIRAGIARSILENDRAVAWILAEASKGITPAKLLGSLSGLAAIQGITPDVKRDIRTLQGDRESDAMGRDRDALERMLDGEGEG